MNIAHYLVHLQTDTEGNRHWRLMSTDGVVHATPLSCLIQHAEKTVYVLEATTQVTVDAMNELIERDLSKTTDAVYVCVLTDIVMSIRGDSPADEVIEWFREQYVSKTLAYAASLGEDGKVVWPSTHLDPKT